MYPPNSDESAQAAIENNTGDSVTEESRNLWTNKNALFLFSVTGISSVLGFGYTYMMSKRSEIQEITAHSTPKAVREQMTQMKEGTKLASRALAFSWILSVGGVSLISYAAWKFSGATSLDDFRQRAGESLPNIPKKEIQGRNDFENLRDLADYLVNEDVKQADLSSKEK